MSDRHVKQNSPQSIVPDLATGWSWNEDGTALSLPLRQGVKWHDGKPFTARDVQCTWHLLFEKSSDKLRVNPLSNPGTAQRIAPKVAIESIGDINLTGCL
jgi:peptide/nickel transport system substrate-binding protein